MWTDTVISQPPQLVQTHILPFNLFFLSTKTRTEWLLWIKTQHVNVEDHVSIYLSFCLLLMCFAPTCSGDLDQHHTFTNNSADWQTVIWVSFWATWSCICPIFQIYNHCAKKNPALDCAWLLKQPSLKCWAHSKIFVLTAEVVLLLAEHAKWISPGNWEMKGATWKSIKAPL